MVTPFSPSDHCHSDLDNDLVMLQQRTLQRLRDTYQHIVSQHLLMVMDDKQNTCQNARGGPTPRAEYAKPLLVSAIQVRNAHLTLGFIIRY